MGVKIGLYAFRFGLVNFQKKEVAGEKLKVTKKSLEEDEERGFNAFFKYLMMIYSFVVSIQIHYPEEEGTPSKYRGEILMHILKFVRIDQIYLIL